LTQLVNKDGFILVRYSRRNKKKTNFTLVIYIVDHITDLAKNYT
jgi:hypothetical protein